jgi:UDP-N-acetyl-2-amino-2-deoxyglucuronate dehydrogenase
MKSFAMIGAAGFIAPRHMRAIKDTGNSMTCALDKFDSVGIIDSFFPNADFFTEFERFDRHVEKLRLQGQGVDYVTVCSPNYLHDAHIRFGLRNDADVICEKPVVLNPWNLDALTNLEQQTGKRVWNILQLRLHDSITDLRRKVDGVNDRKFDVDLSYITSRGNWYFTSWKGDSSKSGGIATNIGVHFFDMLGWIFGPLERNIVHRHEHDLAAGYLEFKKARVRWFLSINAETLPEECTLQNKRTYRSITIDGNSFEFSEGFTELHTKSYEGILSNTGFGLEETRPSIEIVHAIRTMAPVGLNGDYHPLAKLPPGKHPFERGHHF